MIGTKKAVGELLDISSDFVSNDFVKEIIKLWESGETIKDIAKNIGMFHTTVKNIIKNASNGGLTFYDPNLEIEKNKYQSNRDNSFVIGFFLISGYFSLIGVVQKNRAGQNPKL